MTNNSVTIEYAMAVAGRKDAWVPACGGLEVPFLDRHRRRVLYVFNPYRGKHAYLDLDSDMVLPDDYNPSSL